VLVKLVLDAVSFMIASVLAVLDTSGLSAAASELASGVGTYAPWFTKGLPVDIIGYPIGLWFTLDAGVLLWLMVRELYSLVPLKAT